MSKKLIDQAINLVVALALVKNGGRYNPQQWARVNKMARRRVVRRCRKEFAELLDDDGLGIGGYLEISYTKIEELANGEEG